MLRQTLRSLLLLLLQALLLLATPTMAIDIVFDVTGEYQPQVTIAQKLPATKALGSLSMPEGSPWCDPGQRMIWMVGHQALNESPMCEKGPGQWRRNDKVVLDQQDALNARDGDVNIDRHACVAMDVNKDGLLDIVCGVGADSGAATGAGYNEVYLTTPRGRLEKVLLGHGLHKYTSLRNRVTTVVKGLGSDEFVFLGVKHGGTVYNMHRMFVNDFQEYNIQPWFQEVDGPWLQNFTASCAVAAPFIVDQEYDDLIICNQDGDAMLVKQGPNQVFDSLPLSGQYLQNWRSARVHDMDGDGILDLVVTTFQMGNEGAMYETSMLYIFQGGYDETIFDFGEPWFSMMLPNAAPDIEIMDVNSDLLPDIYVVQADERDEAYCGLAEPNSLWHGGVQPPAVRFFGVWPSLTLRC